MYANIRNIFEEHVGSERDKLPSLPGIRVSFRVGVERSRKIRGTFPENRKNINRSFPVEISRPALGSPKIVRLRGAILFRAKATRQASLSRATPAD